MNLLWKTVWSFPKILLTELAYDPSIALMSIYPKELKSGSQKNISTSMFIAALFTVAKIWKQPKCPLMDEWIYDIYIQ